MARRALQPSVQRGRRPSSQPRPRRRPGICWWSCGVVALAEQHGDELGSGGEVAAGFPGCRHVGPSWFSEGIKTPSYRHRTFDPTSRTAHRTGDLYIGESAADWSNAGRGAFDQFREAIQNGPAQQRVRLTDITGSASRTFTVNTEASDFHPKRCQLRGQSH